jgi:diguanylate cyclase (GGDEF)-like protein
VSDREGVAERRVWQLAAGMALAAAALAAPGIRDGWQGFHAPSLICLALMPFFAFTEIVVIHLPAQRSSHSHTLREIPAITGLTFLATGEYVLAYVVGAGLALLLWSRLRGLKLAFNLAMFALEAALGSVVYAAVMGSETDRIDPRAWLACLVAVLVTDLISAAAVTAAISLTEGSFDRTVLGEALRSGIPAATINTCVALLFVTLTIARPTALPLLGAVVVLLVLGYRVYISLARGYARTQQLYEFVEATGRGDGPETAVPAILAETARLLHARRVELVVAPADDEQLRLATWQDGEFAQSTLTLASAVKEWWGPALTGQSVLLEDDDERDGIAVPMRDEVEVVGALHVSERSFDAEGFGREDLRLFEALSAHAAVALSKARAVERLRQVAEERRREALHDPLTGLANRRGFTEAMEQAMDEGIGGAVLLLDLNDFKDVNDTLGHTAGDALLRVTGARLENETHGLVSRLGGDEFAVLLRDLSSAEATEVALRLADAIAKPVPMGDVELTTSASIGVASFVASVTSSDDALAQADVAMYAAKENRSGVATYRAEDGDAIGRRLVLAADLARALAGGELELWFQPQASLEDGAVTGFESLLRWCHPRFGWVPPPEIVAVAQRTGLARQLTDFILEQALRQRASWSEQGYDVEVAVNVTPFDIADVSLVRRVQESLASHSTNADRLVVEVVESDAFADPERAMGVMRELSERGVRLSVDDFGTGYSSLAYLERLPVDEVKIDQSFVFRLEKNPEDSTIVRAAVGLAHDLGLRVIAEGVESELSRSLVAEIGCDVYQGYGLARAMPAAEVVTWLRTNAPASTGGPLTLVHPTDPVADRPAV